MYMHACRSEACHCAWCRHVHRQAEAVCQEIRCQLGTGRMVQLPPGWEMPHVCSVVLLRGTVTMTSSTPTAVSADPESACRQADFEGDKVQHTSYRLCLRRLCGCPQEGSACAHAPQIQLRAS